MHLLFYISKDAYCSIRRGIKILFHLFLLRNTAVLQGMLFLVTRARLHISYARKMHFYLSNYFLLKMNIAVYTPNFNCF